MATATQTLADYIDAIRELDADLTDGIAVKTGNPAVCSCQYGTTRASEIEAAYYANMSANDYVVRAHYESACARADRNS